MCLMCAICWLLWRHNDIVAMGYRNAIIISSVELLSFATKNATMYWLLWQRTNKFTVGYCNVIMISNVELLIFATNRHFET